jgi:hypothetical protein
VTNWLYRFFELLHSMGRDKYIQGLEDARNVAEAMAARVEKSAKEGDAEAVCQLRTANELASRISDLMLTNPSGVIY